MMLSSSGWGAPGGRPLTPATNTSAPIRHHLPGSLSRYEGGWPLEFGQPPSYARPADGRYEPSCALIAECSSGSKPEPRISANGDQATAWASSLMLPLLSLIIARSCPMGATSKGSA